MKYMILVYSNPAFLEVWDQLTDAERMEFGRGHMALTEALTESGELIVGEGLADPALAKRVRATGGKTMTTDGPFAEAKEHLAGFYLIECDGMDRAVEIAAQVPDVEFGEVEVRPVLDLSGLEL